MKHISSVLKGLKFEVAKPPKKTRCVACGHWRTAAPCERCLYLRSRGIA